MAGSRRSPARKTTHSAQLGSSVRTIATVAVLLFLVINAARLGMSDDEAYYWVLSRDPSLGYAFHPPMIAWVIAAFEKLGLLVGLDGSAFLTRLPACFFGALIFWFASDQIRPVAATRGPADHSGLWNLLSFTSFFGIAWMMVPDLPLFFGFILLYTGTAHYLALAAKHGEKALFRALPQASLPILYMVVGSAFALLSKISGVLMVGSAGLAVLLLTESRRWKWSAVVVLVLGGIIGLAPTLIWNSHHEWVSILYQLKDRQAGDFSLKRGFSFWLIQLVLVGPALFIVLGQLISKKSKLPRTEKLWNWVWILPPLLVFGLQPFKASFKLHWSLAFWFPVLLFWLRNPGLFGARLKLAQWTTRLHRAWAVVLLLVLVLPLHVGMLKAMEVMTGHEVDPKADVSTDFLGWSELPQAIRALEEESQILHGLPIVGSRYQTASQAAFAMQSVKRVTLLPRDMRQKLDWPDLNLTVSLGPEWSALKRPVLYVADQRYSEPPRFPGAQCTELPSLDTRRGGRVVKRIFFWSCLP